MFDNAEATCAWQEEEMTCVYREVEFTVRVRYNLHFISHLIFDVK
jgi:hypothetical protein